MARLSVDFLDTNDAFPEMELDLVSGERWNIPQNLGDGYAVFLLYRGYW
jgi:hypothetical protein